MVGRRLTSVASIPVHIDSGRPGAGSYTPAMPPPSDEFAAAGVDRSIGSRNVLTAAMSGSIADRFFAIAGEHPERPALSSPAGSWTYGELGETVRRTAAGLRDLTGPALGRPVAVVATHDGPLVAVVLSIIAAGQVVVVLDPLAPEEQNLLVLDESEARLLIHDEDQRELAERLAVDRHNLRTLALRDVDADPVALPVLGPDAPAMLAFTSGTSGGPKGGIITHGVILNVVRGATDALGITAEDRMPMLFPISMAVAAYPMFIPLLNGGVLATLDVRGVGLAPVGEFLERERITLAYMSPTVVRFLVDALEGLDFPDLRMVALGGEVVDAEVVRLTREVFRPRHVANGFGTTETGVISLYVLSPDEEPDGQVPSGFAVADVDLLILDDAGQPVPPGTSGEIAVASPYLFRGYWGHDDLTAEVLAADPEGRPGWSLYRTGDLGRIDERGALIVLGRLDTKVKVRGRFVVLGDVEAALHELDGVAGAAVHAERRDGHVELVATVVRSADAPIDAVSARSAMLERHPTHAVPTRWSFVAELPRLPNGKVDRRALGSLASVADSADVDDPDPSSTDGEPSDEVARAVRDIWEVLLPVQVVGPDDDFVELGGDSLLAAQMLVMVDQRLGVTVPMGELVHARTLRQLISVVERLAVEGTASTVSCVQVGDESTRPRLWFVHDLQGSAYRVRHLASALGDDQPVWSFESPLLAGVPDRSGGLVGFVERYTTDLLAAQPEGPYWLAGYSFGGICAYEMARQLRAAGHEVAFVGVVDVGPGYRGPGWGDAMSPRRPWFGIRKPAPADAGPVGRARYYLKMVRSSPRGALRHLSVRTGASRLIDAARFRMDLRRDGAVRPEWRLWYAWERHWRLAAHAWDRSSRYSGTVDLFWADGSGSSDSTMGWGPLVTDLRIHRFVGDHEGILEPRGAKELASALRVELDARSAT